MEHHLTIRQRADGFTILANIGDEHDVGQDLIEARREIFRRATHMADRTEISCHAQQVFLQKKHLGKLVLLP